MSESVLESLVAHWGYLAVAVGTFLEGETVLVLAGALAHRGMLSLPLVMAAAFAGSSAGDLFWFFLGRRFGPKLLAKTRRATRRADAVRQWLRRWGSWFVLGFRFAYGLRTISPVLLGAARFPAGRFALLNLVGAALWSAAVASLGYGAGASIHALSGRAARIEEAVAVALAVTLVVVLVSRRQTRKRASVAREHDA